MSLQAAQPGDALEHCTVMPYEPSAPCAACARGVDPLRAACLSVTESSVRYFCSRACREAYLRSEVQHHQKVTSSPSTAKPRETASLPRAVAVEHVARRVAPAPATTPHWPLFVSVGALVTSVLPIPYAGHAAALALTGTALVFARHTPLTRRHAGALSWLLAPCAVALLAGSALLSREVAERFGIPPFFTRLLAAALAVVVMWLREHWLERALAVEHAAHNELAARLSPRVRVSTAPPSSGVRTRQSESVPQLSERPLESLRVDDEVVLEAGSVAPVDGVVVSGFAEVLPYPHARLAVERRRGQVLLAGALLTHGALRVRASQVREQRALFRVFAEHDETPAGGPLALAERARGPELGMLITAAALVAALVSPQLLGAKLAGLAAALLTLPALALAAGLRAAYRRAVLGGSARGVHYREAASIERAGKLDSVVLRVEGTLIPRSYTLVEVCPLSDQHDDGTLLSLALAAGAAAESHAIAEAVRSHAEALGVEPLTVRRLLHTRGRGVTGLTDGQGTLVFGSRAALLEAGVSVAVADREAQRAEALGQRVVFLALGGRARGLFVFAQTVRAEARLALQTLFDLGLEVELVSGDHRTTVESLARTLDITQVKAELSAEQRAAEVKRLRDGEAQVAVIGRIPEDQGLLGAADLSLCVEAAGHAGEHDVVYDITTASADLRDAALALVLARRVRREVRLVMLAAGAAGTLAVLAALGVVSPVLAVAGAVLVDFWCLSPTRAAGDLESK